jgi:hypothetical protein
LHRVVSPAGVLPQAAERLDASAEIAPLEMQVRVGRLNLDGYVPSHAEVALDLVRTDPGVRTLFDARLAAD